jgi:hypothetical protein
MCYFCFVRSGFVYDAFASCTCAAMEISEMATSKFTALKRQIEMRIARQESALAESRLQLEAVDASIAEEIVKANAASPITAPAVKK